MDVLNREKDMAGVLITLFILLTLFKGVGRAFLTAYINAHR